MYFYKEIKNLMTINQCKIVKINEYCSKSGNLVAFENNVIEGFNIARVYFLYNLLQNQTRGNHSHINTSQIIIPIKGEIVVEVDDGKNTKKLFSKTPSEGIYLPKGIWRKATPLTDDTLILVLADKLYKDCKTISNYEDFLTYSKSTS